MPGGLLVVGRDTREKFAGNLKQKSFKQTFPLGLVTIIVTSSADRDKIHLKEKVKRRGGTREP